MRKIAVLLTALVLLMPCAIGKVAAVDAADNVENTETLKTAGESVNMPVIMYHDVMNHRKGRYIVSAAQLESDVKAITEAGYHTVSADEVIAYAAGESELPEKPIMLTFDDGHYNNAYYGLQVFEKYEAKAMFCIVGEYADRYSNADRSEQDKPDYSCLTWDEIKMLSSNPLISIASHSYAMHKQGPRYGILPKKGESDEDYVRALTEDTEKLRGKLYEYTGSYSEAYAYPFGRYCSLARQTLEGLGYKMFFTCNEGVSNIRAGDADSIKQLCRFNREGKYSTAQLMKLLSKY